MNDNTALHLASLPTPNGQPLLNIDTRTMLGRPVLIMPSMPDATSGATPLALLDPRHVRIAEFGIPTVRHLTEKYALEYKEAFLATSYLDAVFERPETITLLKTN